MSMPARRIGILIGIILLFAFPSLVFAAHNIVNFPSEIRMNQQGTVSFSGTFDLNSQYYAKVRLGKNNSFTKAETYNPVTSQWLSDSGEWNSFPVFTTDDSGKLSSEPFNLTWRAKDTTEVGINQLSIRIRKVGTTDNQDSSPAPVDIKILITDPSPSLSPLPSSSPNPSSSPIGNPSKDISNIFINEVMACPESGGSEWVELYNNDSGVDLTTWLIRDSTDSNKKEFSIHINSRSYAKIETSDFLNNDGDSVRLMVEDVQKDSMSYESCEKGHSWSKVNDSWCQTEPTPEGQNSSCLASTTSASPSPSLSPLPTNSNLSSLPSPKLKTNLSSAKKIFEEASFSGEVFGASVSGVQESPKPENKDEKATRKFDFWLPVSLVGAGLLLIIGAGFPWIKLKIIKFFKRDKL